MITSHTPVDHRSNGSTSGLTSYFNSVRSTAHARSGALGPYARNSGGGTHQKQNAFADSSVHDYEQRGGTGPAVNSTSTTGSSTATTSSMSATTASTDATSSSAALRHSDIHDYAPSSNWSNASTEQNFDTQATAKVQEMLLKLDMYMHKETPQLLGNSQLMEECGDWLSLFPHLRICGTQSFLMRDLGYEFISRQQSRACSPYFFIPERPPRSEFTNIPQTVAHHSSISSPSSSLYLSSPSTSSLSTIALSKDELLSICLEGIHLQRESVIRPTSQQEREKAPSESNPAPTPSTMPSGPTELADSLTWTTESSRFDWGDIKTTEAIRSLREVKEKSLKSRWYGTGPVSVQVLATIYSSRRTRR
ncbi:hypothetical protein DFJ73DRAFT_567942 [Zopfochytrium polystomum]|nr:hypothetical protein DFJ73DRAFT_567942 [Zopfochytrium polystomum]